MSTVYEGTGSSALTCSHILTSLYYEKNLATLSNIFTKKVITNI